MKNVQRADELFNRFWKWRMSNFPEFATSVGLHEYDDMLDDMSIDSYARRYNDASNFLKEVENLILASKSEGKDLRLNLELLRADLKQFLTGIEFLSYVWPLNQLEGPQLDFPRLLSWMRKECLEDYTKIIQRMKQFPKQINEIISLLNYGIEKGLVMHELSIKPVIEMLKGITSAPVFETEFWKLFQKKPENILTEVWENLLKEAEQILKECVFNSYKKLLVYLLEVYAKKTRQEVAIKSVPNGLNLYLACLKFHTSTDLTPQEIHDLGRTEVSRISQRMVEVMKQTGFNGTLNEFRNFLKTDPRFKFASAEDMLSHYIKLSEEIRQKLPQIFSRMPSSKFEVVKLSDESAASMPGAYYLAPSDDGGRLGRFYVNTYKPTTKLKFEAMSLCLHEAEPGHHLQSALSMESDSLVNFRRFMEDRKYHEAPARFPINTAYIEGWGLYSEYLGEELGMYQDVYELFGRLSHEILRACRLVVDTGLHALGWSRDQVVQYMSEHTATDIHNINSEVDRYITWPGQACGYKVGEIRIKELRTKAETKLGAKFNLKVFHNMIASLGGVPLHILEMQVDLFIEEHTQ